MVKSDYVRGYEEGVTVMVNAVEQAIKRNRGAKTVVDCVAALNDIIATTHQLKSEVRSYEYSTTEQSKDMYDDVVSLAAKLFPGAKIIKWHGGDGQ